MFRRIKPKEKYVRISMKRVRRNLDGPSKNKEFVELRSDFELSRPKVALLLIKKSSPSSGGSGFPLSLSEWSFTICPTPYNHMKMY